MKKLVLTMPEEKWLEIENYCVLEGVTIAEAMIQGFHLLKSGADAFAETMKKEHDLDATSLAWANKILAEVDMVLEFPFNTVSIGSAEADQCACKSNDLEGRVEVLERTLRKMSYINEDAHKEIFKGFQPGSD